MCLTVSDSTGSSVAVLKYKCIGPGVCICKVTFTVPIILKLYTEKKEGTAVCV